MNDNDIQIVVALANGTLSGDAEKHARECVEADPELAGELATQLAVIAALDDLPIVALSDEERSMLRSNLVEQLHLEPAAAPVPTARNTSRWWKPVAGLAAVAAAAVVFVAVPGLLSGNDSAEDVALVATDTASLEENADIAQAGGADALESAPSETTAALDDLGLESLALVEMSATDVSRLLLSPVNLDATSDGAQKLAGDGAVLTTISIASVEDCVDRLGTSLPVAEFVPLAVTTTDGTQVVHLGVDVDGEIESIISIDLESCQITASNP